MKKTECIWAFLRIGIGYVRAGQWLGLGKWWKRTTLVKKHGWLE